MAIHRFLVGFAVFAVMLLIVESPARANLLTNGSFEDGSAIPQPDGFLELPVGSTVITGWTVTRDEIDYIGTNFWEHADGNRSLDLDGTPGFGVSHNPLPHSSGWTISSPLIWPAAPAVIPL